MLNLGLKAIKKVANKLMIVGMIGMIGMGMVSYASDDFTYESASVYTTSINKPCQKTTRMQIDNVIKMNHADRMFYMGALWFDNDKYNVFVFTDGIKNGSKLNMYYYFNNNTACKVFFENYDYMMNGMGINER